MAQLLIDVYVASYTRVTGVTAQSALYVADLQQSVRYVEFAE